MTGTSLPLFRNLLEEGVISTIDFEFCRFLQEVAPNIHKNVLMAACLTSVAYQSGDVCIYLNDYAGRQLFGNQKKRASLEAPKLSHWIASLKESKVTGAPGDFKPLILDEAGRLYLHRLWYFEQSLAHQILGRVRQAPPPVDMPLLKDGLNRLFNDEAETNWQKVAAVAAVHHLLTIISGGPGTGKTSTVVRLLTVLLEQAKNHDAMPAIALAAPTGKAAARLEASIREAKALLQTDPEIKDSIPAEAVTIHQLLGARRHTARFRYNEDNPLPHDCIVIDEVSMVDQVLMSRLMNALAPHARLIVLGDKDQLASVEAGSVLGDICGRMNQNYFSSGMQKVLQQADIQIPGAHIVAEPQPLTDHIILLKKSYRFDDQSGIGRLAKAVNRGEADQAWQLLNSQQYPSIGISDFKEYACFEDALFKPIIEQFRAVQSSRNIEKTLEIYGKFKILAAHRNGPWGVRTINNRMEKKLQQQHFISPYEKWYPGRPVIINANDYSLGLSNGDLGVCLRDPEDQQLKVYFSSDEKIIAFTPSRLPEHGTAFALTVHKSQGSEFDDIMVVLPDELSPLLSRELLYTAITRARNSVQIIGERAVISHAINNRIARNSGLTDRLWNESAPNYESKKEG